jgi:hypothetical protein
MAAQRAMATAMIYPAGAKGGRGKKNSSVSEGFSSTRLSMARAVLAHSPPIATAVLAGSKSLDEADPHGRRNFSSGVAFPCH